MYYIILILILGAYFKNCISETDLNELNIEIIRNTLYKVCMVDNLEGTG